MQQEREDLKDFYISQLNESCNVTVLKNIIKDINQKWKKREIDGLKRLKILKALRTTVCNSTAIKGKKLAYYLGRTEKIPYKIMDYNGTRLLEILDKEINRG